MQRKQLYYELKQMMEKIGMVGGESPTTFAMLLLGFSAFVFIMLLPALIEVRKPRDAGPRRMTEESETMQFLSKIAAIENGEKAPVLDPALMKRIMDAIAVLPNLEA